MYHPPTPQSHHAHFSTSSELTPPRTVQRNKKQSGHRRSGLSISHGSALDTPERVEGEVPRTVERRRKGKQVDMIYSLPTPPQSLPRSKQFQQSQFQPTPPHASTHSSTDLSPPATVSQVILSPPLSTKPSRRPGLTFAQQMKAASLSWTATEPTHGGVGIGMGGNRLGWSKSLGGGHTELVEGEEDLELTDTEDQPTTSKNVTRPSLGPRMSSGLLKAAPIADLEGGNPFLSLSSPPLNAVMDLDSPKKSMLGLDLSSPLSSPLTTPSSKRPIAMDGHGHHTAASPSGSIDSAMEFSTPQHSSVVTTISSPMSSQKKRVWSKPIKGDEGEENPFLVSSGGGVGSGLFGNAVKKDLRKFEEKKTVDYVFRGTKKTFPNPYYNPTNTDFDLMEEEPPRPRLLFPATTTSEDVDMEVDDVVDGPPTPQGRKTSLKYSGSNKFTSPVAGSKHGRSDDGDEEEIGKKKARVDSGMVMKGGMRF